MSEDTSKGIITLEFEGVGLIWDYTMSWKAEEVPLDSLEGVRFEEDGEPCDLERFMWGTELHRDEIDNHIIEAEWSHDRPWNKDE